MSCNGIAARRRKRHHRAYRSAWHPLWQRHAVMAALFSFRGVKRRQTNARNDNDKH